MKLKDLFEMTPYHAKDESVPKHWKKTLEMFFSNATLERNYEPIGELPIEYQEISKIEFYFLREGKVIYGGFRTENEYGEQGLKVIFVLKFKAKPTLENYPTDIDKNI